LPTEIFHNKNDNDFSLSESEKDAIISALNKVKNNKSEAANLLQISRKTLYNKLKLYNIK
jgi:two-component system, NtrC family, response regulator HydG